MGAAAKLLIIDDDPDLRERLAETLRSHGVVVDVDVASSPEEAQQLIKQNNYQIISTDINHYNSSIPGDAFILNNQDLLKEAKVIVFTGNQLDKIDHFRELREIGVPILEKASDSEHLIELISQKLNESTVNGEESNVPAGFELIHTIDENTGWIGQICWSPDGKRIAAQTSAKGLLVWDRETQESNVIDPDSNPTGGVTWSPDGTTLAHAAKSEVRLFDVLQGRAKAIVNATDDPNRLGPGLSWSPDGKTLAVANRNGIIQLYQTESLSRIKSFTSEGDWIFALAWSPNSSLLAAGGDDKSVKLWDVESEDYQPLTSHTDQITCLAWSPNGELLASGSADKSICIWDPLTEKHLKTLEGHTKRITSVSFSHDGTLFASKSNDGTVRLWRTDNWDLVTELEETAEIPGGLYTPGIAFHPHELVLATLGDQNARIRIWKLKAGVLLKPDEESILSASVSDQPTPTDTLGFGPYVRALARFLTDERTQPPLTLSIEGDWGCGKSSFMLQLEEELKRPSQQQRIKRLLKIRWIIRMRKERIPPIIRHRSWWAELWPLLALPKEERYPTFHSVRFNAWRYDKDSSLWASFALALLRKLSAELPLPLRVWAHLKLTARRFKWIDGWLVLLRTVLIIVAVVALSVTFFYLLYTGGIEKIVGGAAEAKGGEILITLIKGSGIIGYLALLFYVSKTLIENIGNPFTDLKKYLQTPNYDSQIAFIDQFHDDFGKIIKTFAGENKVYVFIDDLDRAEVPKAADLMQAINLLISDSPKVFFIIGMDREKVAAGLAVKYEKILPYLCPPIPKEKSADAEDNSPGGFDSSSGLEFGYSFIEKFIQIPFRIPQPAEPGLMRLLDSISPMIGEIAVTTPARQTSGSTTNNEIRSAFVPDGQTTGQRSTATGTPVPQTTTTAITAEQEERRERIRIAVTQDSMTVRKVVQMVAPALDYNPRRVKQFINMFRLKALIAAETGLFDAPQDVSKNKGLTLPQLGKFVAVSLKWPRLLSDLKEDNSLLKELDNWACERPHHVNTSFSGWLHRPELKELLNYGCQESQDPFNPARPADHSRYSLSNVDLQSLLRITGSVRPTPSTP